MIVPNISPSPIRCLALNSEDVQCFADAGHTTDHFAYVGTDIDRVSWYNYHDERTSYDH